MGLTMDAPPRRKTRRVSRGVYARRFTHGVTWYIRYSAEDRVVREKIGREADGITRTQAVDALAGCGKTRDFVDHGASLC